MTEEKITFQDSLCIDQSLKNDDLNNSEYRKRHRERISRINNLYEKYMGMDERWKSCCFYIDKGLVQFVVESFFAIQVILFCIVQMIRLPDCESQQLYSGILTLVIGILVPQPTLRRKDEPKE
jgi:hypothetical protein